jgi:OOP family OmpA-OmpF porin
MCAIIALENLLLHPMNAKTLVFVVFAVWAAICWRWYVCGLMDACEPTANLANEQVIALPEEQEPAAKDPTPEIQPVSAEPTTNQPINKPSSPVTSDRMDEVQVVTTSNKVVIYYPYKSAKKEENATIDTYLENLAIQLKSSGGKVSITGHTDFVGEPDENYRFGLLRANGIRDVLIKKGVSAAQIKCKSSGDKKPVATNDTPYGRYQNRRVEILVSQ